MSYRYRVFVDIYGNTHYYRKQSSGSTTLTAAISATDTILPILDVFALFNNDLALLNKFNDNALTPQTIWIDNERIEFFNADRPGVLNNRLLQCVRGTAGTAAVAHDINSIVWDGSERQSLLAEASKPISTFTTDDVKSFPWNAAIINFLSQS